MQAVCLAPHSWESLRHWQSSPPLRSRLTANSVLIHDGTERSLLALSRTAGTALISRAHTFTCLVGSVGKVGKTKEEIRPCKLTLANGAEKLHRGRGSSLRLFIVAEDRFFAVELLNCQGVAGLTVEFSRVASRCARSHAFCSHRLRRALCER